MYRPVKLEELAALVEPLEDLADETEIQEIVGFCRSFLTLREDTVYFVHQSAQDFLFKKAFNEVFPHGTEAVHRAILSRSLAMLSRTLHRDMYGLKALGISVNDVERPTPDPLAASCYLCIYWIDHLCDSKPKFGANNSDDLQIIDVVGEFIRKKYLYWLEGLSLYKSIGKGIVSLERLCSLAQVRPTQTTYLCDVLRIDADTIRGCSVEMSFLSYFKMPADSLCTTKGQLKAILSNHMHLRCCSVQQRA